MNTARFLLVASLASLVAVGCAEPSSDAEASESGLTSEAAPAPEPGGPAEAPTFTDGEAPNDHVRVLRDVTTPVVVTLDDTTVFCTARGYGMTVLKVSMPDLDWLAHFDHRVEGEGLPCITAGACTADLQPTSLIDEDEPLATTSVRVVLTEHVILDPVAQTCTRYLDEDVSAEIRGQSFSHHRSGVVEPADVATCEALIAL